MEPNQGAPTRKWKADLVDAALATITAVAFCSLLYLLFHN
jgi:hypothetical protein